MHNPGSPSPRLGRQPALDGIRGIAILAVMCYHFDWPWLPGGFFGVDVFFTLSGFLITTLLLEEHFSSGSISLRKFAFRRCLRLYPALVCLVVFSVTFSLLFNREIPAGRSLIVGFSVLTYWSNWLSIADTGAWFCGMSTTWSLAVEAHFYLTWSLIVAFLARRCSVASQRQPLLERLLAASLAIAALSILWRMIMWRMGADYMRIYLGTDTRFDSVLLGSAAALLRLRGIEFKRLPRLWRFNPRVVASVEAVCALTLGLLFVLVPFGSELPSFGGFTLASLATAFLLVNCLYRPDSLSATFFGWWPLVWVGQVSYSIYLWLMPVAKFLSSDRLAGYGLNPLFAEALRMLVLIVTGAVSYYLVERTFLKWKHSSAARSRVAGLASSAPPRVALD